MTISLKKGQKVSLTKENAGLDRVIVGLGWDAAEKEGKGGFLSMFKAKPADFDCDASAILLQNGRLVRNEDIVYFGRLKHDSGSVIHMGDNLTGNGAGDDEQIVNAMAFALKNMLGLTCDPVCGLVEVPCIKRNSAGAVNAVTSAQMALAGVCSAIAPDEVIDTMRRIGNALPACLKETSEGGLATTPSAQKVREKMDGEQ